MRCASCRDRVMQGLIRDGLVYCYECVDTEEQEPLDTPSLQDSDPEAWGAAHNVNPWGMEGGY